MQHICLKEPIRINLTRLRTTRYMRTFPLGEAIHLMRRAIISEDLALQSLGMNTICQELIALERLDTSDGCRFLNKNNKWVRLETYAAIIIRSMDLLLTEDSKYRLEKLMAVHKDNIARNIENNPKTIL